METPKNPSPSPAPDPSIPEMDWILQCSRSVGV